MAKIQNILAEIDESRHEQNKAIHSTVGSIKAQTKECEKEALHIHDAITSDITDVRMASEKFSTETQELSRTALADLDALETQTSLGLGSVGEKAAALGAAVAESNGSALQCVAAIGETSKQAAGNVAGMLQQRQEQLKATAELSCRATVGFV